MGRRSKATDPMVARILAAVDSESRPYTDGRARYERARQHRRDRADGAGRR